MCYRRIEHIPLGRVKDETVHEDKATFQLRQGHLSLFCEEIKDIKDFFVLTTK